LIEDLNDDAFNMAFQDPQGYTTRVSWAVLTDGSLVLLGLPSANNHPEDVVTRTAVLHEDTWRKECENLIQSKVYGWGWSLNKGGTGNTFRVHPTTEELGSEAPLVTPEPGSPYCEFAYLGDKWEIRLVEMYKEIST
jgi:hypothetical protein